MVNLVMRQSQRPEKSFRSQNFLLFPVYLCLSMAGSNVLYASCYTGETKKTKAVMVPSGRWVAGPKSAFPNHIPWTRQSF